MKVRITKKRYRYATVFVDHFSELKYVHCMSEITSEETIYAKKSFKRHEAGFNVRVEHYHCDNGRFADNAFIQHCEVMGQVITYCGLNTHFQNGRAEKAIRDLQTMARKMILRAKGRWPEAIHLSLWPYALRMAVHVHNNFPNAVDAISRLGAFARIAVSPKSSHYHTFGCPAYMLTTEADQGRAKKWEGRSVLGIYLGKSPHHAVSVSLVLNITTCNDSPQFYMGHDDFFETTRYNRSNTISKSNRKKMSGINHADIIDKKEKVKWADMAQSNTDYSSGVTHAVDLENQAPMFEGTSEIAIISVTSNGSSPSTDLIDASHSDTTVPTSSEPPQHPQTQAPHQVISDITAPAPKPFTAPPGPPIAPPSMSSIGRQRTVSSRRKESIEAGEFKISMFSNFQSTFETQHDLDLELQDKMSNPMAFLAEMQGYTMYFHQAMD